MTVKNKTKSKETRSKGTHMSTEEKIGYYKGSVAVLSKEREELMRMLSIVEQLMQMHVVALKDLGIDLESEAEKLLSETKNAKKQGPPTKPRNKPPIEDII